MKILMHEYSLNERGTSVALYDYAYYLREYLDYIPIICHNINAPTNSSDAIDKFKEQFEVISYSNFNEVQEIVDSRNIDYFYCIKSGELDGVVVKNAKNLIHSVFCTNLNQVHGDVYATVSEWQSSLTGYKLPFVPHMLNLPSVSEDLREQFKIPKDHVVIGRTGGLDTFNVPFVNSCIENILNERSDVWFLFLNTYQAIDHERCLYFEPNVDLEDKVKFINTCDATIHARLDGETFGLSVLEFASRNKQIISYDNVYGARNHFMYLNDNCLKYSNSQELTEIFKNISKENSFDTSYLNEQYSPRNTINKFKEVFLSN